MYEKFNFTENFLNVFCNFNFILSLVNACIHQSPQVNKCTKLGGGPYSEYTRCSRPVRVWRLYSEHAGCPRKSSPWQRGSDPTVGAVGQDQDLCTQHIAQRAQDKGGAEFPTV